MVDRRTNGRYTDILMNRWKDKQMYWLTDGQINRWKKQMGQQTDGLMNRCKYRQADCLTDEQINRRTD